MTTPLKVDAYKWRWQMTVTITHGSFPLDMLRYDHCWPDIIKGSIVGRATPTDPIVVIVTAYSHTKAKSPFTIARWESFFMPGQITLEVF